MRGTLGGDALREVFGEVEYGVGVAGLHEAFGFVEVQAAEVDRNLGRGVHLVDEALAFVAACLVDHDHRQVAHVLILIHEAEDDRVEQRGEEEDEEHGAVLEDAAHLGAQHVPDVEEV